MEISYNVLNLADSIGGNVHYEYLADGTKLAARDATGNGYLYKGSLVYSVNNGALTLESAAFDGGRFIDGEMHYFFTDHLGSTRAAITISEGDGISIVERNDYYPLGKRYGNTTNTIPNNKYRYSNKEEQSFVDVPYIDYGARMYDPQFRLSWNSIDPLAEKYYGISPYAFCAGNPINMIDSDGQEPIAHLVGTTSIFKRLLDSSPRGVGNYSGEQASAYLIGLGKTEFSWKQLRPLPTETGYFNKKVGRYIYTENGGWIDMSHFMFYAGKAYQNKIRGAENPIGDAVQSGYMQELSDKIFAPHSAYSYEDLPSDKFGAEFGASFFDPTSKKTLGEQLEMYFNNSLKATEPQNAPNYHQLPEKEQEKPSQINYTTTPFYTK